MADRENCIYKGYRIEVFQSGTGWLARIYAARTIEGKTRHSDYMGQLQDSSKLRVIELAERWVDNAVWLAAI